jgi:hypothetical protein
VASLTQSISEKDLQIASLEGDIKIENDRVHSRSLSSAESDGSGPSGIAALRSNIDHMGFDSERVSSLLSDASVISSEDQSNLDRLLLFSSSSSAIQASSASLLTDSQMGFVFLKHKVYNYDNGELSAESSATGGGGARQQLLTGLFDSEGDRNASDRPSPVEGSNSGSGSNNLFKEEKQGRSRSQAGATASSSSKVSSHTTLSPLLPLLFPFLFSLLCPYFRLCFSLQTIHYQEFLDRLMNPKSSPICTAIRSASLLPLPLPSLF